MANQVGSFGLDAELAKKRNASYDPAQEQAVRDYIQRKTGKAVEGDFADALKDGVLLCELANAIKAGSCKIGKSKMPFIQMENINNFLSAVASAGVMPSSSFQTVDLFEAKNIGQVVLTIVAFARATGDDISVKLGVDPNSTLL